MATLPLAKSPITKNSTPSGGFADSAGPPEMVIRGGVDFFFRFRFGFRYFFHIFATEIY